jgi:hypothetical protein
MKHGFRTKSKQRILQIIARRKRLAMNGNGLMQFSEYDEIEELVRGNPCSSVARHFVSRKSMARQSVAKKS